MAAAGAWRLAELGSVTTKIATVDTRSSGWSPTGMPTPG